MSSPWLRASVASPQLAPLPVSLDELETNGEFLEESYAGGTGS